MCVVNGEGCSSLQVAVVSLKSRDDGTLIGDMGKARFLFGQRLRGPVNFSFFTRCKETSSSSEFYAQEQYATDTPEIIWHTPELR